MRAQGKLTSSNLIRLDHFPVPTPLVPFVVTLYHFTCDEARLSDVIPAGVGYLMVPLLGTGKVKFVDGTTASSFPLSLLTPTSCAAWVQAREPLHLVGAALSPLGWAALTGLAAYENRDRLVDAAALLGADSRDRAALWRAGYRDAGLAAAQICEELAKLIAANLSVVPPRHVELIRETGDWLSSSFAPPLETLGLRSGYSGRQVERLVKRYFGASPRGLARKYRALRVAALLNSRDCTDEQAAGLIDLFYDQSHMIREMRLFLGRTPSRLADEESPLTTAVNGIDNFRQRKPSFARLPEG